MGECTCHDVLIVKDLNRWFKEKWVDVSRKDPKTGKHPPCGRSKAKKGSKGYPKCRPSVRVSSKTPKTSGEMTSGQKRAATKRKRAKRQGVGGKPTIVKSLVLVKQDGFPENMPDAAPELISVGSMLGVDAPETCTIPGCNNPPMMKARYANPLRSVDYTHHMCPEHAMQYEPDLAQVLVKSPVSPEAKRHKLEYDKKYESTPERVKYREELNRERRRRGIYGKGGPDMSHTKRHTLVAEDPHTNRARHFKERGTLKSAKPIDRELVLVTTGRL
jgi:hypothetical protein